MSAAKSAKSAKSVDFTAVIMKAKNLQSETATLLAKVAKDKEEHKAVNVSKSERAALALRMAVKIIKDHGDFVGLNIVAISNKEFQIRMAAAGFTGNTQYHKIFKDTSAQALVKKATGRNVQFVSARPDFNISREEYRDTVITPREKITDRIIAKNPDKTAGQQITNTVKAWRKKGFNTGTGTALTTVYRRRAALMKQAELDLS